MFGTNLVSNLAVLVSKECIEKYESVRAFCTLVAALETYSSQLYRAKGIPEGRSSRSLDLVQPYQKSRNVHTMCYGSH